MEICGSTYVPSFCLPLFDFTPASCVILRVVVSHTSNNVSSIITCVKLRKQEPHVWLHSEGMRKGGEKRKMEKYWVKLYFFPNFSVSLISRWQMC